jgi:microtubule-associated protein-like 6
MNEGLLGAANGNLLRLEGRKVSSAIPTHKKAVTSLFPFETPEGPCVVSGGMDGMVKILDGELSPMEEREFKVPAGADAMSGQARGVRSVWRNRDGRKLLVGTNGGDIWELSATDGTVMNGGPLVSGHWKHDLRGLAPHPVREEFATVGGDRMLRLWDMQTRRQLNALNVGEMGRCVAFAPNGLFAAVGVGGEEGKPRQADGSVLVVSLMESALRVVTRKQDTNQVRQSGRHMKKEGCIDHT